MISDSSSEDFNFYSSSSSNSSSSESSEDEELENVETPKNISDFEATLPLHNDKEFMENFRVSRHLVEHIAIRFQQSNYYNNHSGGNGKISALKQCLIFLWFAGQQTASFRDIAERFDISISCLSRIIRRITYFLSNLSPEFIRWPLVTEQQQIEAEFRENGFPGVIGAIDGSHLRISKPDDDPDSYINKNSYYSIQMQVVCDKNLRIRDLFVGFPGSVRDSRVFRRSSLNKNLKDNCGNFYILGDSAYPCLPNLLTPFNDFGRLGVVETNFNTQLARNRYVVEHSLGLMKQKFRQLFHIKLRKINDIVHFIRSCCVLHNMTLEDEFQFDIENIQNNDVETEFNDRVENDDREGVMRRLTVANGIFNN